jgi:hypothetical protein
MAVIVAGAVGRGAMSRTLLRIMCGREDCRGVSEFIAHATYRANLFKLGSFSLPTHTSSSRLDGTPIILLHNRAIFTLTQSIHPAKMDRSSAASIVVNAPELVDMVLLNLPTDDILSSKLVSKRLYCIITTSSSITREMIFPAKASYNSAVIPSAEINKRFFDTDVYTPTNAIGTDDFFIPDQPHLQICTPPNLGSLHLAQSGSGEVELYYHLHFDRITPTTLPPLSTTQKNTFLFHTKKSIRINVTNWSMLPQAPGTYVLQPRTWTSFSIAIRPCTLRELVTLVEKIGVVFQLSTQSEVSELLETKSLRLFFTPAEKDLVVVDADFIVGFGSWWEDLAASYTG